MGTSQVETLFPGTPLRSYSDGPCSALLPSKPGECKCQDLEVDQHHAGVQLEIRHIPCKRNPTNTLSRQDKKDALGRKTVVHDTNADLVKELRVPSDADDTAIQEALMRLFNAHVRDQSETVAEEGQTIRAQRSVLELDQALKTKSLDQALKASVSDQISSVQSVSESKPSRSVQFSSDVPVSSSSPSSS